MSNKNKLTAYRLRVGKRISFLRKERKITQQELSKLTGLLQSNIARVEGGKFNTGIDIYSKIAIALKVDLSELFKPVGTISLDLSIQKSQSEVVITNNPSSRKDNNI